MKAYGSKRTFAGCSTHRGNTGKIKIGFPRSAVKNHKRERVVPIEADNHD